MDQRISLLLQNPAAVLLALLSAQVLGQPWAVCALLEVLCSYVTQPSRNMSQKDFLKINNSRPYGEDFSPDWVDCVDPVS